MPELPEVETTASAIEIFTGKKIEKLKIYNRNLRWKISEDIEIHSKNKEIKKIFRRAKYIIFELAEKFLIIHLGMSGNLRILNAKSNSFKKHDHFEIIFNKEKIVFNDVRRFGSLHICDTLEDHFLIRNLGYEPFDKSFNGEYLFRKFKKINSSIKNNIMNQKLVVGVGNIYASESLFDAKIKPLRKASNLSRKECDRLAKSIKKILLTAIKEGGTTIKDFFSADGNKGYFKIKLMVYGRDGKLCKVCQKTIKKVVIGSRSSFFCPKCQN
jgi:formamidopyrimidine-DNA glycosylase